MSKINRFLCRWFKNSEEEYVTLGGFITFAFVYAVVISTILISLYSVYVFISLGGFSVIIPDTEMISFQMYGRMILTVILFFIALYLFGIIFIIIEHIWNIKITRCELKNKIDVEMRSDSLIAKYSMETIPLKTEMLKTEIEGNKEE